MEYFQKKEMDLHSKLEVGEQARKKNESYVSEAEDKDRARAEEREKEKEQLDQLRQQMKDLELNYVTQVKNHEKRASEATVSIVTTTTIATTTIFLFCTLKCVGCA